MSRTQYGERVDRHIYVGIDMTGNSGCESKGDWIDLALAALDQGGIFTEAYEEVVAVLNGQREKLEDKT